MASSVCVEMPIFTTDAQNHLTTANPAACELLSMQPEEVTEFNQLALVHPGHREVIAQWIETEGTNE